ncbi:MAG: hypothetical protein HFJ34_05460 [Clostridia bacterium]|nr:hypothetical protein [Clostridia bacterium]
MLFYHFDMLDHFIQTDLIGNLKAEKESLKEIMNLYNNKKMNLLSITTNMIAISESLDKNKLDTFYEIVTLLKESFEKIKTLQELMTKLDEDLTSTIALYDKSLENNSNEIKANLVEYNKQREDLSHKILEFETIHTTILNSAINLSLAISNKKIKKVNPMVSSVIEKDSKKIDIELEPYDNHVLLISEKEQKAYLPFLYEEVKEIYQNSNQQYRTLQDVIENLYILPLDRFKNSSTARFKESFRLIREKEKGSITKAFDLGLELMFKYELNPIIIAACRNLDELDIYLDCLEENELQEFPCFEIKFEVMPQSVDKQN